MTLYEINQKLYAQQPKLTSAEWEINREKLMQWCQNDKFVATDKDDIDPDMEYFMLLNNEKHDYTVFQVPLWDLNGAAFQKTPMYINSAQVRSCYDENDIQPEYFISQVIEVVTSRGKVHAIEFNTDDTVDFWVQPANEDICYLYKLFNYNWGVIEVD